MRVSRRRTEARPTVLALDPSLSSTGYAYRNRSGDVVAGVFKEPKLRGMERLHSLMGRLTELLERTQPILVVYEDYAMKAKGRNFDIGELGGVYRSLIWRRGIDRLDVTPSSLKMIFNGKGNADKVAMRRTLNVTHLMPHISQDDQVDATALLLLGEAYQYGIGNQFLLRRLDQRLSEPKPGIYVERGRDLGN